MHLFHSKGEWSRSNFLLLLLRDCELLLRFLVTNASVASAVAGSLSSLPERARRRDWQSLRRGGVPSLRMVPYREEINGCLLM